MTVEDDNEHSFHTLPSPTPKTKKNKAINKDLTS